MPVSHEDINEDLRCIILSGRLDIQGTEEISDKFTELSTTAKRYVVVDFTAVTFLASYGIRALISNAKALHKTGGRMAVVVGENIRVARTLESVGIEALLQMYKEFHEAKSALLAQVT
jgi:anti-sigma B factor antagonist